MSKYSKTTLFVLILLAIDQASKIWVKTSMSLGEDITIFNWFHIVFIENPGMAFGITLGSKLFLTLFRIIVSGFVAYYILKLIKNGWKTSYILCVSLIFAGAIGNIFDSLLYGMIFSASTPFDVASLVPFGDGYEAFLNGKVVDMLSFPLFEIPKFVPFIGGEIFFSPIFNLADSFITVGIFTLILFFRKEFNQSFESVFSKNKIEE